MIHSILGLLGSESGSGRTETELKSLRLFEVKKKNKKTTHPTSLHDYS